MQIKITERFLRDFQGLSGSLGNKCRELISEMRQIKPGGLREQALPGWRLHKLTRGARFISLSVDMNYRVLGDLQGEVLVLHRVVKHDTADRANVNRNDQGEAVAELTPNELQPGNVFEALRSFGVAEAEAKFFRDCSTDDDLLLAASEVSDATANLALTLYETSGLVISQARCRVFQNDEDFTRSLGAGGVDWEIYLHPSQSFLVELPADFRAAVVGSAGTGKTICAWHRSRYLIDLGASIGFVSPNDAILNISKNHLFHMTGSAIERSYFFVPKQPGELIQLAETVDHLIIDEAQEIPVTWLQELSNMIPDTTGLTLFYDLNQLGGNIQNNDVRRYRRRISDWKAMIERFPRIQKFGLSVNYRNAREIAEYYLGILAEALPAKPLADVPVFETGKVFQHRVKDREFIDALVGVLRRLLYDHSARDIGIVAFGRNPSKICEALNGYELQVTEDSSHDGTLITTAAKIRGNERQVMIVATRRDLDLIRNYGGAIDAYIAMSRAVKQLLVLEVVS
jgi:hypothetical protein